MSVFEMNLDTDESHHSQNNLWNNIYMHELYAYIYTTHWSYASPTNRLLKSTM